MSKLLIVECQHCHQVFQSYPRYKGGKQHAPRYCSPTCKMEAGRETRVCQECGKAFEVQKSAAKVFCSRSCAQKQNHNRIEKNCETCGKLFAGPVSQYSDRKYCCQACDPRFNTPLVTYTCENCGKQRTVRPSETAKRFCGDKCRLEWFSAHFIGERSPHWQGGRVSYYGPNWRQQRNKARHRDKHTCQRCGIHKDELHEELSVAHILPFKNFGIKRYREANRLSNLISLCRTCHIKFDWENGTRT